jgi:RNA polymerase sigma-70 factor (ECF subfamily)
VEGPSLETTADETRLVHRAQQGDAAACDALIERHQEAAYRLACVIVGQAHEAEDVVQDALVKAYVALPRFRPDAPFRPWLMQIVANEARNRRRAAGRRGAMLQRASAEPRAAGATPETLVLADEQRRVLLAEVNALGDVDRLAIAGRYFLDLSEAELAELLGCARGTVKSRLARGLARLRARVGVRDLLAAAAGLAALGAALALWPTARDVVADRLGVRGISVTHVDTLETAGGALAERPEPAGVAGLGLGPALSVGEARSRFGAEFFVPRGLGPADGTYVAGGHLWLVYAARTGLPDSPALPGVGALLGQFRHGYDRPLSLSKGAPAGTRVEAVQVGATPGVWLAGAPHLFLTLGSGRVEDIPPRLAGNTLLWEQGGLTLRLEAALERDAAVEIATSLQGTDGDGAV